MDTTDQTTPVKEILQHEADPQTPHTPVRKKLNWKGFFIAIIVVILLEIFAVNALRSDNKPTTLLPTPVPTIQTAQSINHKKKIDDMAGKFIWNVPPNSISVNLEKEIKSSFAAYTTSEEKNSNHLSVDSITISTVSANFASATLTVRDAKNTIIPTDGIEYYLHKLNGQWQIIIGGDPDFCQKMKIFPKDLIDGVSYYNYYGCPK